MTIPPDDRRCTATSSRTGERCTAWTATGSEMCSGHAGTGGIRSREHARELAQKGGQARAALRAEARHEARVISVMTPRERIATAMTQRVEGGQVMAALDRGLASSDEKTALAAAGMVLDRLLGRAVAVTEVQLPGTQAYVELRSTLAALAPDERLAYLREQRMVAGLATHTPAQGHELVSGGDEVPQGDARVA